MHSAVPYSVDLMTRVILGLGPPAAQSVLYEDPVPNWEEEVCEQFPASTQPSSVLSDLVNSLDRQPVGWFPPLYPSPYPEAYQNTPPAPISTIPGTPKPNSPDHGYQDTRQESVDSTGPDPTSSVPNSPTLAHSHSPSAPIRESIAKFVRRVEDESGSPEPSPLQTLQKKGRRKILRDSGVKPKAKATRTHGLRSVGAAPSSRPPLEMVQCQWADCTKRLHVDYINVRHWGKHVREHYAKEQDMIQCRWDGGCGALVNKSSMWKHIVVHQPKFKVRCPRGCGVSTRGDMMKRHLQSCSRTSGREIESDEEDESEVEEGDHGSGRDGDGEDDEEMGEA